MPTLAASIRDAALPLLRVTAAPLTTDAGLLFLRVTIGSMMLLGHGLPKLLEYGDRATTFGDPLGVGSTVSLSLAIFGELVCSALIVLGLGTRLAAVPLLVTMLVAALVVHADDPWGRKEFALLYAVPAVTLLLTGAGRFSIDGWLTRRASARRTAAAGSPSGPGTSR